MCWSNTLAHQIFFLRNLCLVFPAGYTQTQYLYIYTHTYPKQLQYLYAWRSTWFYIFYRYERCCPAHHPHLHLHILLFLLRSSKMSKWSTISIPGILFAWHPWVPNFILCYFYCADFAKFFLVKMEDFIYDFFPVFPTWLGTYDFIQKNILV